MNQRYLILIEISVLIFVVAAVLLKIRIDRQHEYDEPMHLVHELLEADKYAEAKKVLEPIADRYWPAAWRLATLYAGGLGVTTA